MQLFITSEVLTHIIKGVFLCQFVFQIFLFFAFTSLREKGEGQSHVNVCSVHNFQADSLESAAGFISALKF